MFLLPAFIVYTLFVVVSVIWAGYYSLFDWSGVGEKIFLGINNYKQLFTQDTVFWTTVLHTLVYTVICVVIQVFGGLLLRFSCQESQSSEPDYRHYIMCR